jgi:serine/threonine-protein kinase
MRPVDAPGRIGRYEVVRLIGEGGMGRVFLARDPVLGREVAVKVLRDDLGLLSEVKAELATRMRSEARAASIVRHPNLVTLHDMGDDDALGVFLVFEYVEGPTMRERLASGALPPLEVARIAMELGAALTAAHEAGVIHRDVKPENVICSSTGAVLTDFGLAFATLRDQRGMTRGTIAYAAPETLADPPSAKSGDAHSAASDQFSLAATLYEALSGKRAFPGEDLLSVAEHIMTGEPAALTTEQTDYREKLMLTRSEGVLRRAFQKEPTLRYPSCRAFGDALGAAIDVRVSSGFPTISMHSASIVPRATRRWQNIVVAGALLVIVVLILMGRGEHEAATKSSGTVPPSSVRPHVRHRGPPPTASDVPSASASSAIAPNLDTIGAP